jgi:superfamily II DNA or RNA helicase
MEITEDWVRGLTGWKPFKDGKAIAGQGLVAGFTQSGEVFQGTLREGRLNLRPVVKVVGPADVRVQCGCPDHRATGGVCAHAVAVLLTALKPPPASRERAAEPVAATPPATPRTGRSSDRPVATPPPQAWDLRLSPRFEADWSAGKIAVRLLPSGTTCGDSDHRLTDWLVSRKLLSGSPQPLALRLAGPDAAAFLELAAGHPRIEIEGRPGSFRIESDPGPPLRLGDSRLEGSHVLLELAPDESRRSLVRWGESPAWVGPDRIQRLPGRSARPEWLGHAMELASNGRLKLLLGVFLADFDAWLDLFEPPQPGWLGSLRLAGAQPDFELELEGTLESLDATLKVRYPGQAARPLPPPGEPIPGLPSLAPDGHLLARDPAAEDRARRHLKALGFQPSSVSAIGSTVSQTSTSHARFRLQGRDAILSFIADDLPPLRQRWTVREGDRFAAVAGRIHVVRPDIQRSGDGDTSLTFELSFQTTGGKRIPSAEIRRLLRSGKRRVKLASGAELVVSRTCEEWVMPLVEELGIGRPDEPFQLAGASSILFQNLREKIRESLSDNHQEGSAEGLGNVSIDGLRAELRPYQELGASWLVDRLGSLGGALLADEMGLGKTLQSIAVINHLKRKESSVKGLFLVVAPTTLLGNWMAELARFAPGLNCLLFHGAARDRLRERIAEVDVIVTSYGTLVRDLAFHLQREYRLILADEASLLRNPDTEISKSLCKLQAGARLALTGTPVENRMQDLWSIFRFVAPGYLGNRADFKERYEAPAAVGAAVPSGLLERLRLRISPFVLRRTKDQVAKDLPDKIEIDEWLNLADDQAALYASLARAGLAEIERIRDQQGEGAGQMHLLTLLLRLRQVCVDPGLLNLDQESVLNAVKIERLIELLLERFENGGKTLVFSQFATNLRRIEKKVETGFGRVFCIDGTTRNRQNLVDAFQAEPGPAVFLISLKAGGYGLNLTAADAVVHLDPWWNPAVEAQATDRAHRIGQTRPVTVYRLLTRGTVEERVRRMQERKRAVIDAATGDSDSIPRNWTGKDLEELLR